MNVAAKIRPGSFIERGVGADQVADHLPRGGVQSAFRAEAHGQRNRALGTEADALRGRFLARSDSDRLSEHINCY
jgi:hypothetical protein